AIGHLQIIAPRPSRHVGETNGLASFNRCKARADQIEIGDAVDLVVIGDSRVAIAEADLRPHIELDPAPAAGRAAERAAGGPAIARKGPGDLLPFPMARIAARMAALDRR